MPRPKRPRKVGFLPEVTYFKPQGVPLSHLEEMTLEVDELEAIRLCDLENLEQVEAAEKMGISQSTFQRILKKARKKIAQGLVLGRAIVVKGGEVKMPRGFGPTSPGLRGAGPGGGRGRMGGPFRGGPGGTCVCVNPECKYEIPHVAGQPCYTQRCPKCGSPMIRKR